MLYHRPFAPCNIANKKFDFCCSLFGLCDFQSCVVTIFFFFFLFISLSSSFVSFHFVHMQILKMFVSLLTESRIYIVTIHYIFKRVAFSIVQHPLHYQIVNRQCFVFAQQQIHDTKKWLQCLLSIHTICSIVQFFNIHSIRSRG